MTITFTLRRFNPRRAMRGVPAAEFECSDGEEMGLLWMDEKDIRQNLKEFGESEELLKGLEHYRTRQEFGRP